MNARPTSRYGHCCQRISADRKRLSLTFPVLQWELAASQNATAAFRMLPF
jgi:hypothetical protein